MKVTFLDLPDTTSTHFQMQSGESPTEPPAAINEIGIFATFVILEILVIVYMGYFVKCIYMYIKFIIQKNKSGGNRLSFNSTYFKH